MDVSSALSDDLSDYDIVSNTSQSGRSLESSIADLGHVPGQTASEVYEPPPSQAARDAFETVRLGAEDIQAYVGRALDVAPNSNSLANQARRIRCSDSKPIRVYVDGVFDQFNVGHALQLRQAKLSFPSVYLLVGVFSDELCNTHSHNHHEAAGPVCVPHVERCEVVRHCRWVDELVPDAPWQVDEQLIRRCRIDYIALDEGTSVDPACDKIRLKGYDDMKRLGRVIPTRRTAGLVRKPVTRATTSTATPSPRTPFEVFPEPLPHPNINIVPPVNLKEEAPDFTEHIDQYGIGY